jgi:plastocyanin
MMIENCYLWRKPTMTSRPPAATRTRLISAVSALVLPAVLIALAGCGGSSSSSSSSAASPASPSSTTASTPAATTPSTAAPAAPGSSTSAQTLSLAANPEGQLAYEPTSLTAKAGKVSIDFTNMSPVGHNVTFASSSGAVVGSTPTFQGASKTLTLNLKPGTYKFYCTVPGHRQAGMEGTLVVK